MTIDKAYLTGQLASLEAQREQAVAQIQQIDGAARLCRSLLGRLERAEDAEAAAAAGGAEAPG